jgi:mRNA interferase RelE/StbE
VARSWTLVLAASAERPLERLPQKVAAATVEFMLGPLIEDPRRVGHPLRRELGGLWSARKGAYRIIYELNDPEHEVQVVRIDHRSDVYRRR